MKDIELLESTPRSTEKVTAYLEREFVRARKEGSTRLPSIQRLARHLKVSVLTVNQVYKRYASEGLIASRPGQGSFMVLDNQDDKEVSSSKDMLQIAINVIAHDDVPADRLDWGGSIEMGLSRRAMELGRRICYFHIRPDKVDRSRTDTSALALWKSLLVDHLQELDGAVLLPIPQRGKIRELLRAAKKPYVVASQPDFGMTCNFVSNDFFNGGYRLGRAWRETGRKRFLFVGLGTYGNPSPSVSALYHGFHLGVGRDFPQEIERFDTLFTTLSEEGLRKSWEEYRAAGGRLPDAILCMSDVQAIWTLKVLGDEGLSIPDEVSVAGCSGLASSQSEWPGLAQVVHPLASIGREVMNMLALRMENPDKDIPGVFLEPKLTGGATLRPEEAEIFSMCKIP